MSFSLEGTPLTIREARLITGTVNLVGKGMNIYDAIDKMGIEDPKVKELAKKAANLYKR
jgi:hypothetical protein